MSKLTMLRALLSVRMRALFHSFYAQKKSGKKSSPAKVAGITVLVFFVVASLLFAMFSIAFMLGALLLPENAWLYFGLTASLAFLLSIFGSVIAAKTQLFDSTDNDILIPMPIPPFLILLSRMISLILSALLYIMMVMLPAGVVYCFFAPVSFPVVVGYLFSNVALTLLSVFLSAFLGYILAWISGFFRNKSLITVICTLGFFVLYMAFYSFLFSVDTESAEDIANLLSTILTTFRGTPIQFVGDALIGNILPLLLLFFGSLLLFTGLVWLLSRGFLTVTKGGLAVKKKAYTGGEMKNSGFRLALLKKDLRMLFTNGTYLVNAALGPLLLILLSGYLIFAGKGLYNDLFLFIDSISAESGMLFSPSDVQSYLILPVAAMALTFLSAGMTTVTAPSISVEAKTIWLLQSLPVRSLDILLSKIYLQLAVTLPPLLLSAVVIGIIFELPVYLWLLVFLCPAVFSVLSAAFGLCMNLLLPKFNAISIGHAAKQSGSVALTLFPLMIVTLAVGFLGFVLVPFIGGILYTLLVTLFAAALSVPCFVFIAIGGARRFASFAP